MAASTANPKIAHHARSNSFPSRPHPLTLTVEEQLCSLRASETTSSSSICHNLAGLKDLYECVENLLQRQHMQQTLSHHGVLDGSLGLLDICGTTRDLLSQMRQSAQDLQSSLRRRTGDLANDISSYRTSRKKINRVARKCLGDLKRMNNKCFFPLLDKDQDLIAIVSVLREVEATTIAVFESLLSFLLGPKARSLVSKLMHTTRVAHEGEEEETSQVKKVDDALSSLISHKTCKGINVNDVKKPLEALEMSIQDLEDGLECVFRCLIKTRVSLLNILNH